MNIYALADSHLAFSCNKPMDKFGYIWRKHSDRIREKNRALLKEDDVLLMPGDISWAMNLIELEADFDFINQLPGKKILLRGNHDYWWSTPSKIKKFIAEKNFNTIDIIQCDSKTIVDDEQKKICIIAGSRLWAMPHEWQNKKDRSIYEREIKRAKISIEAMQKQELEIRNNPKYNEYSIHRIFMGHYPIIDKKQAKTPLLNLMVENKIDIFLYGHLHTYAHKLIVEGQIEGVEFICVSGDYLKFEARKII